MRTHLRRAAAGAAAVAAAMCLTVTAPGTAHAAQGTVLLITFDTPEPLTYENPTGCTVVGTRTATAVYNDTDEVITLFGTDDCTGPSLQVPRGKSERLFGGLGSFYAP